MPSVRVGEPSEPRVSTSGSGGSGGSGGNGRGSAEVSSEDQGPLITTASPLGCQSVSLSL